MASVLFNIFNLSKPLVHPTRLEPNDTGIHARASLIMSIVSIPLNNRLPSTPFAYGAVFVVAAISMVSLLFFEFFRANKEVDQLALKMFLTGGPVAYSAAQRIVEIKSSSNN